jgi:hypothetical protein
MELSEAVWLHKDEIQIEADDLSLTNEMIVLFKNSSTSEMI